MNDPHHCPRWRLVAASVLGSLPGLVGGGLMMLAAWQHNPQGEIHNSETGIAWSYWLLIGASWFAVISGGVALAAVLSWLGWRLLPRR
jgi:hypothetical protein